VNALHITQLRFQKAEVIDVLSFVSEVVSGHLSLLD
jgi:hypothetical protein